MRINNQKAVPVLGAAVAFLIGSMIIVGCNQTESDTGLVITPDDVELVGSGASVLLTASFPGEDVVGAGIVNSNSNLNAMFLPLRWEVVRPDMGKIINAAGDSAVYVSTGLKGNNIVIVYDQQEKEGLASIRQVRAADVED